MPFYNFYCEDCGDKKELRMSMHEAHEWHCKKCDKPMIRDYRTDLPTQTATGREYSKPIISDSLAIHPDQAAEHRKLFPDVPLADGVRPVFTNHDTHQKYLDKVGFVKQPQRVRHKFKKKAAATR